MATDTPLKKASPQGGAFYFLLAALKAWAGTAPWPPLVNGNTYQVEVNVKVNGVWSGFCAANVCSITISNPANRMVETAMGEATLWPNPVHDGQVNLNIEGIQAADQHISVDVMDIYGMRIFGHEFANSGDRFNTVLNLPGDIATGMYMVNLTINGEATTKRLSIVRQLNT